MSQMGHMASHRAHLMGAIHQLEEVEYGDVSASLARRSKDLEAVDIELGFKRDETRGGTKAPLIDGS